MIEDRVQTEITLEVPAGYSDGGRLDVYITGFVLNATRSKVQRAVKEGHVRVNGRVELKPSYSVTAGDVIKCTVWKAPPIRLEPEAIPLDIIHEDARLIVVNKAAGMVVHPAYGHRSGTLVNALLHHVGSPGLDAPGPDDTLDTPDAGDDELGSDDDVGAVPSVGLSTLNHATDDQAAYIRPGIVHRLDKDTSGLMVVAKDVAAHVFLAKQFEVRTIHRTYEAILWGHLPESGEIDAPIGRSARDRKKMAVVRGGKEARTHYRTLRRWEHLSLVEFRLETGRTHQIRVHAAHLGHPVLGDTTYGGDEIKHGPDTRNRRAFFRNLFEVLGRQALHARNLEFVHPESRVLERYGAETPADMLFAMERLEKDR